MGKKMASLVLVVLLALLALAPAALAAATAVVDLPASYSGLNVRQGPGLSYDVVAWVLDGDKITVTDYGTTWSKIKISKNGKTGYIKNIFFDASDEPGEPDEPDDPAPSTPSTGSSYDVGRVTAKYASSYINMRKGPGTQYATVGSAKSGTRLKLYDLTGNWYYAVTSSGLKGYISKNYVGLGANYVTTARVNFRKTPNGALIRTLSSGTNAWVTSVSGGWSKAKVGSSTGYLYNSYLR